MTNQPTPENRVFDAFISYASVDLRVARRIQHFLESWWDRTRKRHLKIYLDRTDIRGGSLNVELADAAANSRTLIVCASPAATDSNWVAEEVLAFSSKNDGGRIAIAIVDGDIDGPEFGRALVPNHEYRAHDLRGNRLFEFLGLGNRTELLRLLAFVADVEMRDLRNWHLRRTLRRIAVFLLIAILPLFLVLNMKLDDWQPVNLSIGNERISPIAAEVQDGRLIVATRFRGQGPQGFRDYIMIVQDALGESPKTNFHEISLQRRLLPEMLLPDSLRQEIPRLNTEKHTGRERSGPYFAAKLPEDRYVYVQPLAPTDEELEQANDDAVDLGLPIPEVMGSLVVTVDRDGPHFATLEDLNPVWDAETTVEGATSPARGLSVAWAPEGDVWLGMVGRDAKESGGLWHRSAGKKDWLRIPGFTSVNSIALEIQSGKTIAVTVAEKYTIRWEGIRLITTPSRVVRFNMGSKIWESASAPPFGSRSDVELVGKLGGNSIIRVDETLYRFNNVRLWRSLMISQ